MTARIRQSRVSRFGERDRFREISSLSFISDPIGRVFSFSRFHFRSGKREFKIVSPRGRKRCDSYARYGARSFFTSATKRRKERGWNERTKLASSSRCRADRKLDAALLYTPFERSTRTACLHVPRPTPKPYRVFFPRNFNTIRKRTSAVPCKYMHTYTYLRAYLYLILQKAREIWSHNSRRRFANIYIS